jgi:hypothetical protein
MNVLCHPRLPTLLLMVSLCSVSTASSEAKKEPKGPCSDGPKEFHLRAGAQYGSQKMYEKAEKEYVAAGESVCPAVRQQALDGLRQIWNAPEDAELELGIFYESQGAWAEAEAHFLKSAENSVKPEVRKAALDGLWRVRKAQTSRLHRLLGYTDLIPMFGGLLARFAAVAVVVWIVSILFAAALGRWQALIILPFDGEKEVAERIAVAFPAVRARVASVVGPIGPVFLPDVVQIVFPFVSPQLGELLPDEAFEVAGVKVPNLSRFLGLFARPRFEVRGGVLSGDTSHLLYAEVWRRRMWFASRLATSVTREIPKQAPQSAELELFVYDVYLSTHATL